MTTTPELPSVERGENMCLPSPSAHQESSMAGAASRHVAPPELVHEARFLLDRLEEWNPESMTDDDCRDWNGHVAPSISRLGTILARISVSEGNPAAEDPKELSGDSHASAARRETPDPYEGHTLDGRPFDDTDALPLPSSPNKVEDLESQVASLKAALERIAGYTKEHGGAAKALKEIRSALSNTAADKGDD